jgi:two-component system, LytTR family, sensor kinase
LRVTIEDNGPGLVDGAAPSGEGIGLSNTMARLQHLYGSRQRLDLVNRDQGGLLLTIELPWHTAEEAVA